MITTETAETVMMIGVPVAATTGMTGMTIAAGTTGMIDADGTMMTEMADVEMIETEMEIAGVIETTATTTGGAAALERTGTTATTIAAPERPRSRHRHPRTICWT